MTHQIVKVDNYLFAIGDNYKHDVFPYLVIEKQTNGGYVVWQVDNLNDWDEKNQYQILAHLPLNGAKYLDGVDVLPPIGDVEVDDVEQLANRFSNDFALIFSPLVVRAIREGFIRGYNKAREKYKWTNEDVIKIVEKSRETELTAEYLMLAMSQQPKLPIGFECEMGPKYVHIGAEKGVKGSGNRIKNKNAGKPKTITNSDGRTQWVGKWVY